MWPIHLDTDREECLGVLRQLECTAYSSVVDAFRAGGPFTDKKREALLELGRLLGVGVERHRVEVRRACSDELLSTVALRLAGPDPSSSWQREGRRIVPLLPRAQPHTTFTSLASKATNDLRIHNSELPAPKDTRTLPPPPPRLARSSSPPQNTAEFALPEPVSRQNGFERKEEEGEENGFVVLPSGMAVRLREESPPASRRGKRKRSASSKLIEIYPEGVPTSRASSVVGAGHGYARPHPTPQSEPPSKRGPGRPSSTGTSSPLLPPLLGAPLVQARGRPRLINSVARSRGPRPRAPRPGLLISPRPPNPAAATPILISQASAVQVTISSPLQSAAGTLQQAPRLAVRAPGAPKATTIQLKHETSSSSSGQSLKVISHSTTKMMPRAGVTAVYMLPSAPRMSAAPHRLLAISSSAAPQLLSTSTPRLLSSGLGFPTGVIRTVRARPPGAKPSVIVVQKGSATGLAPQQRATRPATVALYRPARGLAPGSPAPRLQSPGDVILLDLAQDQTSHTLSNLFTTSSILPAAESSATETGGQRKIFLQRPVAASSSQVWVESPTTTTVATAAELTQPSSTSTTPSSVPSTSSLGRMVTLPHRSTDSKPTPSPPPTLEVRPPVATEAMGEA